MLPIPMATENSPSALFVVVANEPFPIACAFSPIATDDHAEEYEPLPSAIARSAVAVAPSTSNAELPIAIAPPPEALDHAPNASAFSDADAPMPVTRSPRISVRPFRRTVKALDLLLAFVPLPTMKSALPTVFDPAVPSGVLY